ncbi:hypothetical protein IKQ26_00810 [bacterium]|nr:hypothetical protein [bacterium]
MQISSINTILPRYSASFKSEKVNDELRRRRRRAEQIEQQEVITTPQYDVQRSDRARVHRRNTKGMAKRAVLFTLAGATAGAIAGNIATDQMIKSKAMANPVAIVEHISGAPEELIYEWQINGMTVYPKLEKGAIVSNSADYTNEQIANIKNAQNELADVYYNRNNGIVYAVLNKDTDIREIKATFGISMTTETSVEKLNNLYNKETIGADLNTAKIEKGNIIKFNISEAGEKGNFYGALLNKVQVP